MLTRLKKWVAAKNLDLKPMDVSKAISPAPQENTKDVATRKRVHAAFDAQWEVMQARAMKPHSFECKDPWACTKDPCWEFVPDKIVKESVVDR